MLINYSNCAYYLRKDDFQAFVTDSTNTLPLMDKFEGRSKESDGPYKRLIFKNSYQATIGKYLCKYHLILERFEDVQHTEGDMTFTVFKKEKGVSVYHYCNNQLRKALKEDKNILKRKEFYFYIPYYLRAQHSGKREGYGWEWDWSDGIGIPTEGTMYGDTDDYGFVGVVFESVTLKKDPVQQESRSNNLKVELTIFKGQKYYKILKSEEESFLIPYKQGMSKQDAIRIYNNSFL